jgi:HAMP domain-containing protein/signal transduction histidine kinase/CheY-like chemotaxis protein
LNDGIGDRRDGDWEEGLMSADAPVPLPGVRIPPARRTSQRTARPEPLERGDLLDALTRLKKGDFRVRLTPGRRGVDRRIAKAFNDVVLRNRLMSVELARLSQLVGKEGRISERARLEGAQGSWAASVRSVNALIADLVRPTIETSRVIGAVAQGDLSQKMELTSAGRPLQGEFLRTARTLNRMVHQLSSFASEVTRVAREVGTEGKLGGQAKVKGVAGTWKDLTQNVNLMAGNLTGQVRNIAAVTTAVAKGDLTKKITVDVKGEFLELKATINTMVGQLRSFASEVTRVAREVGTEGKLGGQARVEGVSGTWKDLTDSVNSMAGNLTSQVRNIADVTTAVANGDLSKKITVDVKGEILELKDTINTMVDQLRSFASEVTRVAREVGTEGRLGGQADVRDVAGTWKDLTDSVNFMAGNLTSQVRNIADVTKAVAKGDLSRKITVDVKGEVLELKNTVNTMVDQLSSFAAEVTRVAREVGTEGKLGGQARVEGVSGTWKDLTDSVNFMAGNLTGQVRNIAEVTTAVANGDLSKKITVDVRGEILELKDTINTMVDQLRSFASEVTRVAREVGTEGKLGGQADVRDVAGTWKDLTDNVNFMAGNLTSQVRNIAEVTTAVARGDLSKKITVDVKGEILEVKNTVNTMVDQLSSFAAEVTRVAREVGTEGKLGGQADVRGVAGTWKDLTDNVNFMAGNLTSQVRGIARVVTAVANGDLKRKLILEAKGEIAALADTINGMSDTLATFAAQVTTMAREVGVEGKLGGQASVPGAAGTWKDLTDNVNQLAANLTTQVRAIAEVATAVTKGDLTRSIKVEASGEVAALKDNINEMIRNLKDTTLKNSEQDWLKTNLAKFSRMLQGQRDLIAVGKLILSELAPVVSAQQGIFYTLDTSEDEPRLKLLASYACRPQNLREYLKLGEALVGQCAIEKQKILLDQVPGDYLRISSGLGDSRPAHIIVLPVLFEGQLKGVVELASFERFNPAHQALLDQLTESIGIVLHTIESNTRTEDLLKQSQSLAGELQTQQEELRETNQQLEEKAALLAERNVEVERKNQEVEQARLALEEKARQLALTSKYKSEFLANMSHELRTPLNSLLILSDQLSRNPDGNLTGRQTEFAKTIHGSGNELLALINDILDLSKIESGTVVVDAGELRLSELLDYVDRTFRHVADARRLELRVSAGIDAPRSIVTDSKRLQQVIKNLLSNAFKFTERGSVSLQVDAASGGWSPGLESLDRAESVVAISVTDTGIGIHPDKQQIIFEAFQQADGSTSRKYGGTGLGLAISREIARLLGGEIRLTSSPGTGSTFTLFIPAVYSVAPQAQRALPEPQSRIVSVMSDVDAVRIVEPALEYEVADDRVRIRPDDRVLLIIENDENFARFLIDLAHEQGFKAVVALSGTEGLTLAQQLGHVDAITLDIQLPVIDGWRILDRLKSDLTTRHIPVYLITTEEETERAFPLGAIGVLQKPVKTRDALDGVFLQVRRALDRTTREVLVACPEANRTQKIVEALRQDGVRITALSSLAEGLGALDERAYDCVVLSASAAVGEPAETVSQLVRQCETRRIPVVLLAPEDEPASEAWEQAVRLSRGDSFVKTVRSLERLVDQTFLHLHRRVSELSQEQRQMIEQLYGTEQALAGKKVLIVDDDIRNIFALTSVLERQRMEVIAAETGKEAIAKLEATPGIDVVLMDIMMPDMDGYDTMRAIRKTGQFKSLPIIAVTAKAMKGDREKTLQAGAWDYLAKPVDTEQMLSVLRSWLHR